MYQCSNAFIADRSLFSQNGALTPVPNIWVANCDQTAADSDMVTIASL